MPTSVRLDEATVRLLETLARRMSATRSEVIRKAIQALFEQERRSRQDRGAGPYQRASDLLGSVSGGPPDLSTETGRRFEDLLEKERRRGRERDR